MGNLICPGHLESLIDCNCLGFCIFFLKKLVLFCTTNSILNRVLMWKWLFSAYYFSFIYDHFLRFSNKKMRLNLPFLLWIYFILNSDELWRNTKKASWRPWTLCAKFSSVKVSIWWFMNLKKWSWREKITTFSYKPLTKILFHYLFLSKACEYSAQKVENCTS